MNVFDIWIIVLYDNFFCMREKGRKVIPWFQTCSSISMIAAMFTVFMLKLLLDITHGGYYEITFGEIPFLIFFLSVMGVVYFLVKRLYFTNDKYIGLYSTFKQKSRKERLYYKIFTYFIFGVLPFILIYILYLDDKNFRK